MLLLQNLSGCMDLLGDGRGIRSRGPERRRHRKKTTLACIEILRMTYYAARRHTVGVDGLYAFRVQTTLGEGEFCVYHLPYS